MANDKVEVELKFKVDDEDSLKALLEEWDPIWETSRREIDYYFDHPSRSFGKTDEALRLRSIHDRVVLTYKGPKLDQTTKTRREIEVTLAGDALAPAIQVLEALGFTKVLLVSKERLPAKVRHLGFEIDLVFDQVEQLGGFVELEILISADRIDQAKEAIFSLSQKLGLKNSERRSYLELLLASLPCEKPS